MNAFTLRWLRLRRDADERARWRAGARLFLRALPDVSLPVVDLGCGSGANCAYLAHLSERPLHWRLVDHDPALLAEALGACTSLPYVRRLECLELDLSRELEQSVSGGVAGITASALLDLVSHQWLDRLSALCVRSRVPLLLSLTYSGQVTLLPGDDDDELIHRLIEQHQRRDKGFGAALGSLAPSTAARLLSAGNYRVSSVASDWVLDSAERSDAALLEPLLAGWAQAATELVEERADMQSAVRRIGSWLDRRLHATALGVLKARVGHVDLLALPEASSRPD